MMNRLGWIGCTPLIENRMMTERVQVKFPRYHKKSWRAVKKFRRRYTEMRPSRQVLLVRGLGIVGHPEALRDLRAKMMSQTPA